MNIAHIARTKPLHNPPALQATLFEILSGAGTYEFTLGYCATGQELIHGEAWIRI